MVKEKLKLFIPVAILFFLVWTIARYWGSIEGTVVLVNPSLILFSLLVLVTVHIGGAYFWYKILQAVSFKTSFKEAFRVFVVSNFGRFIPGVVLHYVARVYLSKKLGLKAKDGVSAVFLEAYYTLAGAVVVSVLALPVLLQLMSEGFLKLPAAFSQTGAILFTAAVFCSIIFISPGKIFKLAYRIPFFGKHLPHSLSEASLKGHVLLIGISSSLFIADGVAFYLLSSAFTVNPWQRLAEFSGLFSAAWIVGFLTPVAPGGLGVSDLSFAFLLTPFYTFAVASFLAVLFRFGKLLSEGIIFLFVIKLFGLDILNPKPEEKAYEN